jgi:23S rRNA (cytosine1962-C5)-methyltransferase
MLKLWQRTGPSSIYFPTPAPRPWRGGATSVHNVDSSATALAACAEQLKLNNLPVDACTSEEADVFAWLDAHNERAYDLVILDPPALTKTAKDKENAGRAYHFLNRAALRLLKPGGILVTSSCSHFFTEDDLAFVVRRASVQAGVNFQLLRTLRQAPDHPLSVYFPESAYLKSFIGVID